MFVQRDWNRTEHDDLVLNVYPKMGPDDGATPIYGNYSTGNDGVVRTHDCEPFIIGWKIKPLYE